MNDSSRRAGVLLHISSLPGGENNGELGSDTFRFIDFLVNAGIKIWQVLPLGPTLSDKSPYQSTSAHAGNPDLISIETLSQSEWVDHQELQDYLDSNTDAKSPDRNSLFFLFLLQFRARASESSRLAFNEFISNHAYWLTEFALYAALKKKYDGKSWVDWPKNIRDRNKAALEVEKTAITDDIETTMFIQFIFQLQWKSIRSYANKKGLKIFGDLPLFVSHDSADVWANRTYFKLDEFGQSLFVAGVPPDYFSETGQRWGNPVYDWEQHEADNFHWWVERLKTQFALFDIVRIDHFRGLASYWEIPAECETALQGEWVDAPGGKMLSAVEAEFGKKLPLIAEDLGSITEQVVALKDQFSLPGMKILQFAFGGDADNPYLPHNHVKNSVIYTGTHDNNTTLGWFMASSEAVKKHVYQYYGGNQEQVPALLVRSAFASVAFNAIVPLQDLMELDESGRMNVPGTADGNWSWRFSWDDLDMQKVTADLRYLCHLYQR